MKKKDSVKKEKKKPLVQVAVDPNRCRVRRVDSNSAEF